jgi:hypothetical protein
MSVFAAKRYIIQPQGMPEASIVTQSVMLLGWQMNTSGLDAVFYPLPIHDTITQRFNRQSHVTLLAATTPQAMRKRLPSWWRTATDRCFSWEPCDTSAPAMLNRAGTLSCTGRQAERVVRPVR